MKRKQILAKCIAVLVYIIIPINWLVAQENNQSGYVITKTNDTIRGYIQNVNINQFTRCSFKVNKDSKIVDYLPGEIVAYRFGENGKFFISKETPSTSGNKILFLEYLIKGKASIYFMRDNTDHYYIQKEDDKLLELTEPQKITNNAEGNYLTPQKYTGRLKYVLSDCPSIYSEIDALKLYPDQLIKLAKDYHEKVCDSEKCIVFEKKNNPVKFHIGVLAGISYNDFKFNATNYTDDRLGAFAGCKVEIENLIYALERITLNTGLIFQYYSTYKFHIDVYQYSYSDFTGNQILNLNLNATAFKIPLTVNYMLTQSKVRPYIGGGITNMFFLSQNKDIYIKDFTDYFGKTIPFYHFGIIGTAGLKYQLKNRHSLFVEFNYEKISNLNVNEVLRMHNQSLSLQAGYMF